jgi:hypothetical protein
VEEEAVGRWGGMVVEWFDMIDIGGRFVD